MFTVTLKNGINALSDGKFVKTFSNRTQAQKAAANNGMMVWVNPFNPRVFLVVEAA